MGNCSIDWARTNITRADAFICMCQQMSPFEKIHPLNLVPKRVNLLLNEHVLAIDLLRNPG